MKESQGRRIIRHLRRKPHTTMEMLMLGISVCPWKRVREAMREGESLVKGERNGLVTWAVRLNQRT